MADPGVRICDCVLRIAPTSASRRGKSFVLRQGEAIRLAPRPQPVRQICHAQVQPGQLQQRLRRVVDFGVDVGVVQRVTAAGHAQEAGGLLERLRPQPLDLLELGAGSERAVSSRCATMAWATRLLMPAT